MYVFTSFSPTIFVQATTNERCAKTAPRASMNNPGMMPQAKTQLKTICQRRKGSERMGFSGNQVKGSV